MSEGAIKQNLLRNKRKLKKILERKEKKKDAEKTMRTLMNNNTFMVRIGRRTLIDKKNFRNG